MRRSSPGIECAVLFLTPRLLLAAPQQHRGQSWSSAGVVRAASLTVVHCAVGGTDCASGALELC